MGLLLVSSHRYRLSANMHETAHCGSGLDPPSLVWRASLCFAGVIYPTQGIHFVAEKISLTAQVRTGCMYLRPRWRDTGVCFKVSNAIFAFHQMRTGYIPTNEDLPNLIYISYIHSCLDLRSPLTDCLNPCVILPYDGGRWYGTRTDASTLR